MSEIHCFTSISFSYLSRARILAKTLRELHPDWILWLCISDQEPEGYSFNLNDEAFDHVIWVQDLPLKALQSWIFKHNVVELCTAVKGFVLNHILNTGAPIVIYIDPDIALFNKMDPVLEALEEASIVLTPHLVDPESTSNLENERSTLLHGIYNLGFLAIKNSSEGRRCAQWWQERLEMWCYESAPEGIYTDQRWCDFIPAFFDEVKILRDPGCNVASWNLSKRHVYFDRQGNLRADGSLLRFYHFTKIENAGQQMIDRYIGDSVAVIEIVKWYREAIQRESVKGIPPKWWAYGKYSDNTPIAYPHRLLYRARKDLREAFPDPFLSQTYLEWLKTNELF
jgi:hypothetical protein